MFRSCCFKADKQVMLATPPNSHTGVGTMNTGNLSRTAQQLASDLYNNSKDNESLISYGTIDKLYTPSGENATITGQQETSNPNNNRLLEDFNNLKHDMDFQQHLNAMLDSSTDNRSIPSIIKTLGDSDHPTMSNISDSGDEYEDDSLIGYGNG